MEKVLKRILCGLACVGLSFSAVLGLMCALALFAYEDGTWLFRVGVALIILALFIQGFTSGGDNNSEAKSAD